MGEYKIDQAAVGKAGPLSLEFKISQLVTQAGHLGMDQIQIYTEAAKDRASQAIDKLIGNEIKLPEAHQFESPLFKIDGVEKRTRTLDSVTIPAGEYKCFDSFGKVVKRKFDEINFPPITLIEKRSPNEISRTLPNSGYGSVKMAWAVNDWEISFTSLVLGPDRFTYPEEAHKNLLQLREIQDSVPVFCKFLNDAGIDHLVFMEPTFRQKVGKPHSLDFSIAAWSDTKYDIEYLLKAST